MIDIVVDSSVALKWLVREQDSELAIRLLSPAVRRLAPDLLLVEVANALWKNERLKRIDPAIARRGVAELPRFFTEFFSAHDLVADASSLARDLDHPVYDCLYIIAARRADQLGFAAVPVGEAARIVNEETLVVVMLESPKGIENCEAIAAVAGIDALLIGTNDLCAEMGIPGQFTDPRVEAAYKTVIDACRKHGKAWGRPAATFEQLQQFHAQGATLVSHGGEFLALMEMLQKSAQNFERLESGGK